MAAGRLSPDHRFADRVEAGQRLAQALDFLRGEDVVVLALPRGGVPVAFEIACALGAPLDVLLVRKIGAPGHPELGLGAVVDGPQPQPLFNERLVQLVRPSPSYLEAEVRRQLEVIEDRKRRWLRGRASEPVAGRVVVLVDDGIATGGTVRAALLALASSGARRTLLAVPVAPPDALQQLPLAPQDFVCLLMPQDFRAVGMHYIDFTQTEDDEVMALLERASRRGPGAAAGAQRSPPEAPG